MSSRPKRKTVAELMAERDKLTKRIEQERKREKEEQDKDILSAVAKLEEVTGKGHNEIADYLRQQVENIVAHRQGQQQ